MFGPAAKIGWGTPTNVEGTVAQLLEVPAPMRLVLLGNVSTALPTRDEPIIELNVDVLGEVNFSRKTLAIDASGNSIKRVPGPRRDLRIRSRASSGRASDALRE